MSKHYPIALACVVLSLAFTGVAAAECEHAVTNMDMIDCWRGEYEKATDALLEQIKELKKHLYPQEQKALDKAQAAWIVYRKAHCDSVVSTWWAGSGGGLAGMTCFANLTKDRVKQLREDFADQLTSPFPLQLLPGEEKKGSGVFFEPRLFKELNLGNYAAVPDEMRRWNKERNPKTKTLVISPGLTTRREAEAQLFASESQ